MSISTIFPPLTVMPPTENSSPSRVETAVVAEDLPGPGSVFLHVDWSFKAPVRPGDEITAEVEVLEAREDKPLTRLLTTIVNQEGTVVLDGTALVWTEPV
jgi:acyl dehydratase